MATFTPRMQLERLCIGDDPLTLYGHVIERVDNLTYLVDGKYVYGTRQPLAAVHDVIMCRVTGEPLPSRRKQAAA